MYVPRLDRKWSNFPPCAGLVQLLTCLSEQFCKHYHGLGASSLTERLTPGGSGSVQEVPINHSPNHMIIATFQQKRKKKNRHPWAGLGNFHFFLLAGCLFLQVTTCQHAPTNISFLMCGHYKSMAESTKYERELEHEITHYKHASALHCNLGHV